ncbi:MAG: MnhB domain-containing protein, partial [Bradymonadaceae bacterium]
VEPRSHDPQQLLRHLAVGDQVVAAQGWVEALGLPCGCEDAFTLVDPHDLIGSGLLMAFASGLPSLFMGQAFLTAQWWDLEVPVFGLIHLSTPLFFDIGVYLTVLGAVLAIVIALAEAEE